MKQSRLFSPGFMAILVAIGCGSGKPQDAGATGDHATHTDASAPIQLAAAPMDAKPAGGGTASIQGTVRLEGTASKSEPIKMNADPVCQQQHQGPVYAEDVVANDQGMLKNVFVYVKEGAKGPFPAPTQAVTLDQNGCWYQPHVFGIQVGQPLEIVNSDGTLHNINAKPTVNQPFNVAQPVKGMKTTKKFTKPEVAVSFKCNVHPWMRAYAGVVENPFFGVSDENGAVTISRLPAGTYVLEAWHEKYGTHIQTVTVGDGETKAVQFTFKAQ